MLRNKTCYTRTKDKSNPLSSTEKVKRKDFSGLRLQIQQAILNQSGYVAVSLHDVMHILNTRGL